MINLYKTDLRRVFKDKLFFIVCILGIVFSAMLPLLYKLILFAGGMETEEAAMIGMDLGSMFSAKSMFFESFLPGGNFGLIMPVLLAIILCKDFSFGTVRNKIIGGYSRTKIFLSLFFTATTIICIVMLLHALLTLGIALIFFDYQPTEFTTSDMIYLITSVAMEMLVYVCIAALVSFLCVSMKNVGLVIVLYIAITLIMTIVDSIAMVGISIISIESPDSTLCNVLEIFRKLNIFSSTSIIGSGTEYSLSDALYCTLPPAGFTVLLIAFSIINFKKKDLK